MPYNKWIKDKVLIKEWLTFSGIKKAEGMCSYWRITNNKNNFEHTLFI
jgi:hypothetical protein